MVQHEACHNPALCDHVTDGGMIAKDNEVNRTKSSRSLARLDIKQVMPNRIICFLQLRSAVCKRSQASMPARSIHPLQLLHAAAGWLRIPITLKQSSHSVFIAALQCAAHTTVLRALRMDRRCKALCARADYSITPTDVSVCLQRGCCNCPTN